MQPFCFYPRLLLNRTLASKGLNVRSAWQYLHSPLMVWRGAPSIQRWAPVGDIAQPLRSVVGCCCSFVVIHFSPFPTAIQPSNDIVPEFDAIQ